MDEIGENVVMDQVNLSALTTETVNSFQEVVGQKNVTLEVDIDDNISLKGNAEQLKQMISILTENASKYVTENGYIRISLKTDRKHIIFRIQNTADLEENLDCKRLFDRFYRSDSSRNSETGGHGIGLSIAKKIATNYGGDLSAQKSDDGIYFIAEISKG